MNEFAEFEKDGKKVNVNGSGGAEKEIVDENGENQQDSSDSTMSSQDMSASHVKEAKQTDGVQETGEVDGTAGKGDLSQLQC